MKKIDKTKDKLFLFESAACRTVKLAAQHIRGLIGVIVLFIALPNLGNCAYAQGFDDKDFSLRFPAALSRFSSYADDSDNTSWTDGPGIYPFKQVSFDLGYQYNMFPEIKAEFGRSHLLTISISVIL